MEKTCCFTGHRQLEHSEKEVEGMAWALIMEAIVEKGYTHFISGGAIGFDTIAAETVLKLKKESFPNITLEIAIPCLDQSASWNKVQKKRYADIITKADKKTVVQQLYNRYCMQLRNKYMVNNSSMIIAYFTGKPGGTKNTLEYAKRQGLNIAHF